MPDATILRRRAFRRSIHKASTRKPNRATASAITTLNGMVTAETRAPAFTATPTHTAAVSPHNEPTTSLALLVQYAAASAGPKNQNIVKKRRARSKIPAATRIGSAPFKVITGGPSPRRSGLCPREGGLFLFGGIPLFFLLYREELRGVRGDDLVFGIARDHLDRDVLEAREEEPFAHARFEEEVLLLVGEIEGLLQHIDRGGRLLQQQLE